MISQKKGKCGGESEYTTDSLTKTSSALEFSPLSEVRNPKFKILQILALTRPPQWVTTDTTVFYEPLKLVSSSL